MKRIVSFVGLSILAPRSKDAMHLSQQILLQYLTFKFDASLIEV
jgi:hypothetical protein